MTGCMHRDTHQTITAETNILDIKPDLNVNCGDATLVLHEEGGWALPGGGRSIGGDQVKSSALNLAATIKRCKSQ
jgi:hypothetical protein